MHVLSNNVCKQLLMTSSNLDSFLFLKSSFVPSHFTVQAGKGDKRYREYNWPFFLWYACPRLFWWAVRLSEPIKFENAKKSCKNEKHTHKSDRPSEQSWTSISKRGKYGSYTPFIFYLPCLRLSGTVCKFEKCKYEKKFSSAIEL